MPRVKRGVSHVKHRKNILRRAKGYKWGRKKKLKLAKTAITKAGVYSYRDRRNKKRDFRALWQTQLNAALRMRGTSYARFMGALHNANIILDRKILADLAQREPKIFDAIVKSVS